MRSLRTGGTDLWVVSRAKTGNNDSTHESTGSENAYCSDGLYQIDVSRLKPGEIILSNMPSKILRASNEAKLEAAPWQANITPQMQLYKEISFLDHQEEEI